MANGFNVVLPEMFQTVIRALYAKVIVHGLPTELIFWDRLRLDHRQMIPLAADV
jgi:hypothetical protein